MNGAVGRDRRAFLRATGVSCLAPSLAAASPPLPTVAIGKFAVTRLVAGYNPIGGYSHSVPKLSAIMRNWFTLERTLDFLRSCERNGINTWQASVDPKVFAAIRQVRAEGSRLQWICLMRDVEEAGWREIIDLKPLAVVHHGEATDRLYEAGQQGKIGDFIRKAHDKGVLAGISSHVPAHIARSEDAGWDHDLYMTCFYNLRFDREKVRAGLGDVPVDELYLTRDPDRMTAVMRQVKRPCLGFKIFAAGRLCQTRKSMEQAFEYAYAHIKPADAVIVGMFPILTDEVAEDVAMAAGALAGGGRGRSS